jgi:hypothetical protein
VIPIGVEEDEGHALLLRNGELRSAYSVIHTPEDVGRIREGYCCVRCYEIQDTPFPEECWVCKFPMRERQAEFFAKAFQGERRAGPSMSLDDELALLEETEAHMLREELGQRPISIVVPRGL